MLRRAGAVALLLALSWTGAAARPESWTQPVKPFEIVDNIYYVGTRGLASYLIVSGRQAILLDGTLAENVGTIERNIRALGFRLADVKIILNSHAHYDHAAGIAGLKKDTGARVMAMAEDRSALENGRQEGDTTYGGAKFPPVTVDQELHDGDVVRLGDVTMTATLTPGHTKGCTTWSMDVSTPTGKKRVVFLCSITVAGNILVGNKSYPGIVADFRRSFDRLASIKADIVLTAHPEAADLFARKARAAAGEKDAYEDPGLLPRMVDKARAAFETSLKAARR